MTSIVLYATILILELLVYPGNLLKLSSPRVDKAKDLLKKPFDHDMNFTQITATNGYLSEEHTTMTEDGYILRIHRIIQAKHCKGPKKQPPVLLMHGLQQSSESWIDSGTKAGLAYLLADDCYDVWLGNQRGNFHSRRHDCLNPDVDSEFWQFSFHEIGLYDIPATIDYILNYTEAEDVNYIGFSQGSGTALIMFSERPEYRDKIRLMICLAPATRLRHTKSVSFRTAAKTVEATQDAQQSAGVYELLPKGGPGQKALSLSCRLVTTPINLCRELLTIIDAPHPGSISDETVRSLFQHVPAGTSIRLMAHHSQELRSENFMKFDYGTSENMIIYGSERPPKYNLYAVDAPVLVVYGKNDGLVDPRDVKWLVNQLPNVLEAYEVTDPKWTHFDNNYSQYVDKMIFPKISEYLQKYSYET